MGFWLALRSKVTAWIGIVVAMAAAILAAYLRGKSEAKKEFESELDRQRLNSVLKANEVKHEVDSWDDERLIDVARGWVRNTED
jgi:hypothetical protein